MAEEVIGNVSGCDRVGIGMQLISASALSDCTLMVMYEVHGG